MYIDIPCLIYNESFCKAKGIDFTGTMNIEQLFDIINKVRKDESLKELYYINNIFLTKHLFYQYLRSNTGFNNDLFKSLASSCRNTINYTDDAIYGGAGNIFYNLFNKNTDLMFVYLPDNSYILEIADTEQIKATCIPYITENKSNVGTCYFLVVNPASKTLRMHLHISVL